MPTLVLDIMELTRYRQCWSDDEPCMDEYGYAHNFSKQKSSSKEEYLRFYHRLLQKNRNQTHSLNGNTGLKIATFVEDRWPESLKQFQIVQAWLVHFFIFFVLPFVFLCLASFCLLSAVKMSGRFVRQHCIRGGVEFRNTVREEARMTALILCLIGAFFICQSPFVAYSACHKVGILSKPSRSHSLLRAIITLALALKSDCTFVFHCWLNQRFALALRRMLCSFSVNAASGHCYGSKSYSQYDSQNRYSSHQAQTRSLIKHHVIQQTSHTEERQIKILLKEIDYGRKAVVHLNQNFNKNEERIRKVPRLPFSKPIEMVQMGLNKGEEGNRKISSEDAVQTKVADEPLFKKHSTDGTLQKSNNDPRIILMLQTHGSKSPMVNVPKQCGRKQIHFFSENDLYTSCTMADCSCGSLYQATSFCSSLDCTVETSAQCRYSLTKSYSLPPLNSTNSPFYHLFSIPYDGI
ncbi:conserved hypothetical protein [Echinococcus multilocularis]|uniref:G-protein coupled receptors family 1 profile domain-containing protein n=1 Tax=Echinococcus multilocularis TaxID=6211 RepID=A0A068YBW2_ECHMU|nr:conserved hypothetical protein [Echinococcus multilocularis]